jgi:hypothetical protein
MMKRFFQPQVRLGRNFIKGNAIFLGYFQSFILPYFPFVFEIALAGKKNNLYFVLAVVLYLAYPTIDMGEAEGIGNAIDKHNSITTLVEVLGDCSEAFLACSIPYVKGSFIVFAFDFLDFEINSHCAQVVLLELVISVSHHDGCLAYPAISHD